MVEAGGEDALGQGGQARPGGSAWLQGGLGEMREKGQIQIPGHKGRPQDLCLPAAQNPFLCHFRSSL